MALLANLAKVEPSLFFLPLLIDLPHEWGQVACGWRHTAALATSGAPFTWGDGYQMQLGHGDQLMQLRPKLVALLAATRLRQLECGNHHCVAVCARGQVYTWGSGSRGQLGHGIGRNEAVPRIVSALSGWHIVRVACGWHSLALTADGQLFSWGDGRHGQLGHRTFHAELSPRRIDALSGVRMVGIACGDFHTLALAEERRVYSWGSGVYGELGHGVHRSRTRHPFPHSIPHLDGLEIIHAACGASHNMLLVKNP